MCEFIIEKAKTVCVSGHRSLDYNFSQEKVKNIFIDLINAGFNTFLIGMAVGFDSVCFRILENLRKNYPIKIIACIPCKNQDINFNDLQKMEYLRELDNADERIYVGEEYTKYCMQKRNRFLVDNSSVLVCYLKKPTGGTAYTHSYAIKNDIKIIKV